jgi:hypothetical protein
MASPELTLFQRLCVFHATSLDTTAAFALRDEEITYELLSAHGCTFQGLVAAGLRAPALHRLGFDTVDKLREVGMDAFDLVDIVWTRDLVRLFGADTVRAAFVVTAGDAVALAGTESARVLGVRLDDSLALCAGEPTAAASVIALERSMPTALEQTTVRRLLDTGLRANALAKVGVSLAVLIEHVRPTSGELTALGFRIGV